VKSFQMNKCIKNSKNNINIQKEKLLLKLSVFHKKKKKSFSNKLCNRLGLHNVI